MEQVDPPLPGGMADVYGPIKVVERAFLSILQRLDVWAASVVRQTCERPSSEGGPTGQRRVLSSDTLRRMVTTVGGCLNDDKTKFPGYRGVSLCAGAVRAAAGAAAAATAVVVGEVIGEVIVVAAVAAETVPGGHQLRDAAPQQQQQQ